MSRNLEARIARLEEAIGNRSELAVIVWGDPGGGPLKGYEIGSRFDRLTISRMPGESDEQLKQRAIAQDGERRLPADPIRFLWECRH